jgi:hypothetical protein
MGLVKTVGDKLDTRIKSGEIKESELIAEASDLMNKMKDMPGMGNIQSMLNKMGMGNLGGGKVNTAAMESQLNKRMKTAQMKERMRAKAEANLQAKAQTASASTNATPVQPTISEEEIIKIFSSGEKAERTPRGAKPSQSTGDKKKKKVKK